MAEHDTLTDPYLHEPKGIAALNGGATDADKVYVSDGAGSGDWDLPPEQHQVIWKDNIQPFVQNDVGSLTAPTFVKIQDDGSGSTGIWGYSFSPTSEEELFVYFHIDHDYKVGTPIYPHIHWAPADDTAGTVRWGIEYSAVVRDDTSPQPIAATSIITMDETVSSNQLDHIVTEYSAGLTIPNMEPDTIIICRVFRDATASADNYAGEAIGLFCDIHYQADRVGTINKAPDFYT